VFGSRNGIVHHLLTPHFFVWFVEWNELIHHHYISHKLITSNNMRNEFIPPNLWNCFLDASPYLEWINSSNQTPHKSSSSIFLLKYAFSVDIANDSVILIFLYLFLSPV
jgi:hypothetical protein